MFSFFNKAELLNDQLQLLQLECSSLKSTIAAFSDTLAMIEFLPDGQIVTANQNFLNVMGYGLSALVGKHHSLFCDSATKKSSEYAGFWKALASGQSSQGRFLRLSKNGGEVWLEASYCPVKDTNGKVTKIIKIASDITEQVIKNQELQSQSEAVSRSMATIEFSPDGKIIVANQNFLDTMGYSMEELLGKHHKIFCGKDVATSPAYREFWQKLNKGEFYSGKIHRLNKQGEKVWLEATYNPIFDSKGRLYKVVKFASDITEAINNSQRTSELVQKSCAETNDISLKGKNKVGQAIDAMSSISNGLSGASENINSLSEQSGQISNIVNTITAIADQTNLLALNAAIEAARAGEQGRGFAVVADEVRQLAARTSRSTAEIDDVVKRNNQFASSAVKAMEKIVTDSSIGTTLIQEAGEVIDEIELSTKKMVGMVATMS